MSTDFSGFEQQDVNLTSGLKHTPLSELFSQEQTTPRVESSPTIDKSLTTIGESLTIKTRNNNMTAYDHVFEPHPENNEHYIHRRIASLEEDTIEDSILKISMDTIKTHVPTLNTNPTDTNPDFGHTEIGESIIKTTKELGKLAFNEKIEVTEDIIQHKYSRLANAAYDYYNSNGDSSVVEEGLSDSKYSYIEDLGGFKVDTSLSTKDNLVLFNESTGETHVAYRGTTDNPLGETREFINDWKNNVKIASGDNNTGRVQEARAQMERVIAKYGKGYLTFSGHSQGGNISIEMGLENEAKGYHFNPATNMGQVERLAEEGNQIIFKTPLDFASGFAHHPKAKPFTTIVNNLENMDSVLDTHSLEQFAPKVNTIQGAGVSVTRRGFLSSIGKGLGHAANGAAIGYQAYTDINKDFKGSGTTAEKTINSVVDIAADTENFLFTNAVIDMSLGMAYPTMGLSLVVGYGIHLIHDDLVNGGAEAIKTNVKAIGNQIARGEKSVTRDVKKGVNAVEKAAEREARKVEKSIADEARAAERRAKNAANAFANEAKREAKAAERRAKNTANAFANEAKREARAVSNFFGF
jgi:hypothetical protein